MNPPADSRPASIAFSINGIPVELITRPDETLLDLLRDRLGWTAAKHGCDRGVCGACSVLMNNRPRRACRVPASTLSGSSVITVEAIHTLPAPACHLPESFTRFGAVQCGFCTPGMLIRAASLLLNNFAPSTEDITEAISGSLCRCTGYRQMIDAIHWTAHGSPEPPAPGDAVGSSRQRLDSPAKTRGRTEYTADLTLPGCLFGALVRSPFPHARITGIDVTEAASVSGVVRVITAEDLPADRHYGKAKRDQPVLASKRVRFVGEAVALVLATSPVIARRAAQRVEVRYRELHPVWDPESALLPDSPQLHDHGNLCSELNLQRGNWTHATDRADAIIDRTYYTPCVEHALLEPEAGIARMNGNTLEVIAPSQNVFFDRHLLAGILGISNTSIRVVLAPTGGSFGKREDLSAQLYAALGAFLTHCPVKLVFSRRESFLATTKRHAVRLRHRTWVTRTGTLLAADIEILADTGAYSSWAPNILRKLLVHAAGAYHWPAIRIRARAVYTNNGIAGAMRGFGATQALTAIERQIDETAHCLAIDPTRLRQQNLLKNGDYSATGQLMERTAGGQTLARAVSLLDQEPQPPPAPGIVRGQGSAVILYGIGYGHGIPDIGSAIIELTPTGDIILRVGTVDYGQGSSTIFAQMVSQMLMIPVNRIDIITADTSSTPDSGSSVASRQTFTTGNAVVKACNALARRLRSKAAEIWQSDPDTCRLVPDGMVEDGSNRRTISFRRLAAALPELHQRKTQARFRNRSTSLDPDTGQGNPYSPYAWGSQAAEVEIDTNRGTIRVTRLAAVHNLGRVINPAAVLGQLYGGIAMGLGYALSEKYEFVFGQPQPTGLDRYRIPRASDMPEILVELMQQENPEGPFGAVGIGEPAMLPTAPAVLNAIAHAAAISITRFPISEIPSSALRLNSPRSNETSRKES